MLRSPFKSEGLNLVGLFQKINKGYYEEIPAVYSDHLRGLVKRMISLTSSDRPSMQEVREACRTRPPSAVLQERMRQHQTAAENNNKDTTSKEPEARSSRSRSSRRKNSPENENPSRPSSSDQQQEAPPQSRPPSSQGDTSNGQSEEMVRKRHAEARMELIFERLRILRYEKVLKKSISPTYFSSDSRMLPKVTPQSRFEDMRILSQWLLSLLGGGESDDQHEIPPIVVAQKILLAAEKVGVPEVAQLSAPALTSGVGIEVCELLDALTAAVVSGEEYCTTPPAYPREPIETLESCDALDVTNDDGQQNASSDGIGESTTSLDTEDNDVFSRWVVVKEERQISGLAEDNDRENAMIHTDIDPVAWELERRRMLPKLHTLLQDKLHHRPAESSWRVRLDQVQAHASSIVIGQEDMRNEIVQLQAQLVPSIQTRQQQTDQLERYEKVLNKRYLRARRLHHEGTTRLSKAQSEMHTAQVSYLSTTSFYNILSVEFIVVAIVLLPKQENVNQATVEVARLQAARSEQANALKAADAQLTDNSMLLERKRQVRHLINENRELGLKLQVLQDYWNRKQHHAAQCSHLDPV
ncbi:hypothetical protein ON010_g3326 [Phytophthora cinnamomi]|nr:hypothetical protein ON010_g3326 [Phytophthora cinnamomi]